MRTVTIHHAEPTDLAGVQADVVALFTEDSGARDATISRDWPQSHAAAWLEDQMASERKVLLIARSDGQVGYLAGELLAPSAMRTVSVAVLVSMYVRPAFRGRGVGRRLVEAFGDWARERRAERMSVTAFAANTDAVRFYERFGFTPRQIQLETAVD